MDELREQLHDLVTRAAAEDARLADERERQRLEQFREHVATARDPEFARRLVNLVSFAIAARVGGRARTVEHLTLMRERLLAAVLDALRDARRATVPAEIVHLEERARGVRA